MRKSMLIMMGIALLVSGCSSTGEGAYVGGQFGHILGSAIGGIAGGGRGHDVGSLVGTLGGAVAGAAVGAANEKARAQKLVERAEQQRAQAPVVNTRSSRAHGSGYTDEGLADDRIDFVNDASSLEIRNAVIVEDRKDGVLTRGEACAVKFEIYNHSNYPVYDVRPLVENVSGNKHVRISPSLLVESIAPHSGVRYTATMQADNKLKDGEIVVLVGVMEGLKTVDAQTRKFTVPTAKKAQ